MAHRHTRKQRKQRKQRKTKRQMIRSKTHRRKKSYGGALEDDIIQLKRNITHGEADKVQDFVEKYSHLGLEIRNSMIRSNVLGLERIFNIDLSTITDEVREILIEWGYINE